MAENPANLHVVGRTADGLLWHTIRSPSAWTPFGDVLAAAGLPSLRGRVVDVACARRAAFAAPGNVEGLYVLVAFEDEPPRLLFRSSHNGSWSQQPGAFFPNARKVAAGTFTSVPQGSGTGLNQIHMAAVTDDGHLLTAFANAAATQPVQQPDDVETTAGETGELRAVGAGSSHGEFECMGGPGDLYRHILRRSMVRDNHDDLRRWHLQHRRRRLDQRGASGRWDNHRRPTVASTAYSDLDLP